MQHAFAVESMRHLFGGDLNPIFVVDSESDSDDGILRQQQPIVIDDSDSDEPIAASSTSEDEDSDMITQSQHENSCDHAAKTPSKSTLGKRVFTHEQEDNTDEEMGANSRGSKLVKRLRRNKSG